MSEIVVNKNFDYNKDSSSATYEKYGKFEGKDVLSTKEKLSHSDFDINEKPELINKALDIKNRIDELNDKKSKEIENNMERDNQ